MGGFGDGVCVQLLPTLLLLCPSPLPLSLLGQSPQPAEHKQGLWALKTLRLPGDAQWNVDVRDPVSSCVFYPSNVSRNVYRNMAVLNRDSWSLICAKMQNWLNPKIP